MSFEKDQTLPPPDSFYLSGAMGWVDLGLAREALAELGQISPANRRHPLVMQVTWTVWAGIPDWDEALAVAAELTRDHPTASFGWIHASYSLHELKKTREALENLLAVVERFPREYLVPYNLACYCAQLDDLSSAKGWLKKASALAGPAKIREMGREDPDLVPVIDYIESLH